MSQREKHRPTMKRSLIIIGWLVWEFFCSFYSRVLAEVIEEPHQTGANRLLPIASSDCIFHNDTSRERIYLTNTSLRWLYLITWAHSCIQPGNGGWEHSQRWFRLPHGPTPVLWQYHEPPLYATPQLRHGGKVNYLETLRYHIDVAGGLTVRMWDWIS